MNNIKKNYKRLNNVISYINNKYYIGKLYLLIDIFICKIKYKANLNDYKMFSMYLLNNKERKTLLTSGKNLVLANKLNNNSQLHIFLYKNEFNDVFNDYLKRKWMFINRKNYNEFESFIKNMDYIIAKSNNNTNGKKIEKIKVGEYDIKNLYNYLKDKKVTYVHADICWHRDEKYYASDYWRGKKKLEGGGVLINQAIHTLDLLQWFCGSPKSVVADINNFSLKDKIEVEDSAMVLFKGEKSSYSIFATNSAKIDLSPIINLKLETGENIILSKDRLIVDNKIIEIKDDINIYGKRCYGNGHEHLISDFYYKIEKKKKFEIDAEEAIVSSKMVLYAYKSRGKIKIIEE